MSPAQSRPVPAEAGYAAVPVSELANSDDLEVEDEEGQPLPQQPESRGRRIWRTARLALPSFLLPAEAVPFTERRRPLHPTAYLDGIRGYASLIVCFTHYILFDFMRMDYGFGHPVEGQQDTFLQLPLLRVIVSAAAMVVVFFVVSGFAISYKPLKVQRSGDLLNLIVTLSSAVFRRGLRLFIPLVLINIIGQVNWAFGGYGWEDWSIWDHIVNLVVVLHNYTNPWRQATPHPIVGKNGHMWTIPVEFRGSMVVFACILGLCKVRTSLRLPTLVALLAWAVLVPSLELAAFIAGLLLADVHHIRVARERAARAVPITAPLGEPEKASRGGVRAFVSRWGTEMIWTFLCFFAIFVLSRPINDTAESSGYSFMALDIPEDNSLHPLQDFFWHWFGAVLLVFSVDSSRIFKAFFTSRFALYLGDISYAIYVTHLLIILTFKAPVLRASRSLCGYEPGTEKNWGISYILAMCVMWPFLFWVADLWWRFVDIKAVDFAKWLLDYFWREPKEDEKSVGL